MTQPGRRICYTCGQEMGAGGHPTKAEECAARGLFHTFMVVDAQDAIRRGLAAEPPVLPSFALKPK
jgi:hypothetical protein